MEIAPRARRRKSHFHPWKSFIGKKQTADAAAFAEQRAAEVPALRKLTVGLIDTYEAINVAYYEKKRKEGRAARSKPRDGGARADDGAAAAAARDEKAISDALASAAVAVPSQSAPHLSVTPASGGDGKGSGGSPQSVRYCDENHDYIVRTGEMFNNRYMLEKVIGRGSFGQVVRAYDTRENTHVAIKIIKNSALYVEQALSEVRMTSYLNRIDPNDEHAIMRLRDKFIFRGHQCLVLELLSFSLYDLLRSTEFFGVSLNLVRKFCRQILNCLSFLARPDVNVAHCDLKPENVLLRHPQRSAIKVVDFGASCRVSESMFTYVQSRFYRAPEVILGLPYDTQVDVWSLGCMLVELHTGYPLFAGRDEADQISIIVERIGMPPQHMLDKGRKTSFFFDKNPETGEWKLKHGIARKEEPIEPGSKPVASFVDEFTGASAGKRKRSSDGHSDHDYDVFLNLTSEMLEYDPVLRISAEQALRNGFVTGALVAAETPARSGRDSPPCLPEMDSVGMPSELHPGRKAPVQRKVAQNRQGVRFEMDDESQALSTLSNHAGSVDGTADLDIIGGALRLSKSEPVFDQVKTSDAVGLMHTPAVTEYLFYMSSWAEEVGIEPPLWRGGAAQRPGARRVRLGDGSDTCGGPSNDAPLCAAGGGERRPSRRPGAPRCAPGLRTPVLIASGAGADGSPRATERARRRAAAAAAAAPPTRSTPFPLGTSAIAIRASRRDAHARRIAALTRARPPPLRVAGHGDALLLPRDSCDRRRLALANSAPPDATSAALYF